VKTVDFVVDRNNLRDCRFVEAPAPELSADQVRVRIDRFALTSNNVTYGVFGDAMHYWAFFPTAAPWGRIPVWGYAEVVQTRHALLRTGERIYGFLPMSTHAVLLPERVGDKGFVDAAPHRAGLPPAYQQYLRAGGATAAEQDVSALLRPLFMTSFLIDDFFALHDLFGAQRIVLASASSKTALGTAFLLKRRAAAEIVGLTSPRNAAFCERVGYYDRVLSYDRLAELPAGEPAAFVDMAGAGQVLGQVHQHFGERLRYSCVVGATHWSERKTRHALPGAKPVFFFAPDHYRQRAAELTPRGLEQQFALAWRAFTASVAQWLTVVHGSGEVAVREAYLQVLDGRSAPERGQILSLLA
jgi:hypothetical protein